ncbi:MAG: histidine phosphatase family protein [Solirubrobacterales bacterium]|nr:histidine phosphatase family protein [Solirubrobacterales bacterium]
MAARTLHLLRHAKSSWDDPGLADSERPLNARGRRAAATIAGYVRERAVVPELVLCSPAVRTRQTLELVAPGFPADAPPRVEFEPGIYEATAAELLALLRGIDPAVVSAMMIGHQPALQELACALTGSLADRSRLAGKFPTAALATFSIEPPWAELDRGAATLRDYVKPKELARRR